MTITIEVAGARLTLSAPGQASVKHDFKTGDEAREAAEDLLELFQREMAALWLKEREGK